MYNFTEVKIILLYLNLERYFMGFQINDLYAGKPDAKDEIYYEGLEGFIKTFVVPTNTNLKQLVDGSYCFISGYKGTGKTALLFYLDNYVKSKVDEQACTSFIFFKDEFTDTKSNALESLSQRMLSSISIDSNTLLSVTEFEYIWRWILFKRIIADNQDNNYGLFENNAEWKEFETHVGKIVDPINTRKIHITPKIKLSNIFKDKTFNTEMGPEFEGEVDFQVQDNALLQFTKFIDIAESLFIKVKRTDIPYYIFIDELEAYYGDKKVFQRDLCLIRDLVFTVKRFNGLFMQIQKKHFKIICSIRTEIMKSISRFTVSKELNKVVSGFEVPLIWDYSNTNSYSHPIMMILIKRIAFCEGIEIDSENTARKLYQRWFPEEVHKIEPANYILNNSWFKPRDIVRLIITAQNSVKGDSTKFTQSVFDAYQKKYSIESLTEIREEMQALYNAEEIELIIACFTGFRAMFNLSDLQNRIDKIFPDTILSTKLNQIIEDLYRLGFLGNYLQASRTYRWQHKGDDMVIISEEWRFMIHFALQSALSVGTQQDFSLKRKDKPKIGDVLEVTVLNVNQHFANVTFVKNNITYRGYIHVSEYNDMFISSLSAWISKDDTFLASILKYDEDRKTWSLSKKNVILFDSIN